MQVDLLHLNGWMWLAWGTAWFAAAALASKAKTKESLLQRQKHTLPTLVALALIFNFFGHAWIYDNHMINHNLQLCGLGFTGVSLIGTLWARLNLGKNWSGIITIKENHQLIRTGAYRFVRHPIYTGFFCASFGSVLSAQTGDALIGLVIIVITYYFKAKREEKVLILEFGESYRNYQTEVPMLIPR